MNIDLTFDAEYQNALSQMRAEFNANANLNLTESEYLAEICRGAVKGKVKALFDAEVARIGTAAASLPYAERQNLIAQIESQLP